MRLVFDLYKGNRKDNGHYYLGFRGTPYRDPANKHDVLLLWGVAYY